MTLPITLQPLPALELLECVRRACPDMPVFDLDLEGEIPR